MFAPGINLLIQFSESGLAGFPKFDSFPHIFTVERKQQKFVWM